jgi:magnesium-transporting ATPase (P-type)
VGKISALLMTTEPEATPLQMKLEKIARDIGKFGLISSILVVSVLCLRFLVDRTTSGEWDKDKHWKELLDYIVLGVKKF